MLSKKISPDMKRSEEASCSHCKNLHTTCYSFIRAKILSPTEEVCDYARWGCQRYDGPGSKNIKRATYNITKSSRLKVYETLQSEKLISLNKLVNKLDLEKQIVLNNIHRLKVQGVEIKRLFFNGEPHYQIFS